MAVNPEFIKGLDNISYCGKQANEILSKAIFETDLYGYGITYRPGVKGKEQLIFGEVSDVFQPYTCAFTPNGEVSLAEEWIEPFEMKANLESCYDVFWKTFLAEETRIAYVGESAIPRTFFEWYFEDVLVKEMKREYEDIFFNGDTKATSGKDYLKIGDGIVAKLKASDKTVKVSGAVLTVDNILAQIEAVAAKGAVEVRDDEYKIFINYGHLKQIKTALGNEKIFDNYMWNNWTKGDDRIYVYGYEIVGCQIAKDTILLAPQKNMILGFDLESDATTFQVLDQSRVTGDNTFRVIALTNMAVGVVYPELFVLSMPA